jgi:hypothetical protein
LLVLEVSAKKVNSRVFKTRVNARVGKQQGFWNGESTNYKEGQVSSHLLMQ